MKKKVFQASVVKKFIFFPPSLQRMQIFEHGIVIHVLGSVSC